MSLLVASSIGRLYRVDLLTHKVTAAQGEVGNAMKVVDMDCFGDSHYVIANQKGDVVVCNFDDELQTTGERVFEDGQTCVGMQLFGSEAIVASREGVVKTVGFDFNKKDDSYNISGTRTIIEAQQFANISRIRLDRETGRLACLQDGRPPVVVTGD